MSANRNKSCFSAILSPIYQFCRNILNRNSVPTMIKHNIQTVILVNCRLQWCRSSRFLQCHLCLLSQLFLFLLQRTITHQIFSIVINQHKCEISSNSHTDYLYRGGSFFICYISTSLNSQNPCCIF